MSHILFMAVLLLFGALVERSQGARTNMANLSIGLAEADGCGTGVCCNAGIRGHWCFYGFPWVIERSNGKRDTKCPGNSPITFPFVGDDQQTWLRVETLSNVYEIGGGNGSIGYQYVNRMPESAWKPGLHPNEPTPPQAIPFGQSIYGIFDTSRTRYYGSPGSTDSSPKADNYCAGKKRYPRGKDVKEKVQRYSTVPARVEDTRRSSAGSRGRPEMNSREPMLEVKERDTYSRGASRREAYEVKKEQAASRPRPAVRAEADAHGLGDFSGTGTTGDCNDGAAQDFLHQLKTQRVKSLAPFRDNDCGNTNAPNFPTGRMTAAMKPWFDKCCQNFQDYLAASKQ